MKFKRVEVAKYKTCFDVDQVCRVDICNFHIVAFAVHPCLTVYCLPVKR